MATWQIVNDFTEKLGNETHNLTSDTFKVALSNTAPTAATANFGSLTEISAGNGYTAGGTALSSVTYTETGGTATFAFGSDLTFTASGGAIATFRYLYLYNDTAATDEGVAFLDYGTTVDLADGESFTLTAGTVFTLAEA